jgi:sugar-specific transcriptional regulator TrmB
MGGGLPTLEEVLRDQGLRERSARVYRVVREQGPLRASEVALRAGLHRVQAYRELYGLLAEGLVGSAGKPARFSVVAPVRTLSRWRAASDEESRELEALRAALPREGWGLQPHSSRRLGETWIEGRRAIRRHFFELVAGCRSTLDVGFPPMAALAQDLRSELRTLQGAARRGVRVRVLAVGDAPSSRASRYLLAVSRGAVRYVPPSYAYSAFALVDGRTLLLTVIGTPWVRRGESEVALTTRAQDVVRAFRRRFDGLFETGSRTGVPGGRRPRGGRAA